MLKFSHTNSKMNILARHFGYKLAQVVSFDIPAGWSCPKADICKNFSDPTTGKIKKVGRIMCYASKVEAYAPAARRLRWHNFDEIKECAGNSDKIAAKILEALPNEVKIVRIHSSGDFFSVAYFTAWQKVAAARPNIVFFGYTKQLEYAISEQNSPNFFLEYSFGGKDDEIYLNLLSKPAACFINEHDNQYPNIPVVCGSKEKGYEDYFGVIGRNTFAISMH